MGDEDKTILWTIALTSAFWFGGLLFEHSCVAPPDLHRACADTVKATFPGKSWEWVDCAAVDEWTVCAVRVKDQVHTVKLITCEKP